MLPIEELEVNSGRETIMLTHPRGKLDESIPLESASKFQGTGLVGSWYSKGNVGDAGKQLVEFLLLTPAVGFFHTKALRILTVSSSCSSAH